MVDRKGSVRTDVFSEKDDMEGRKLMFTKLIYTTGTLNCISLNLNHYSSYLFNPIIQTRVGCEERLRKSWKLFSIPAQ